jgi:AraC-like DNA-binding protein
VTPLQVLTGDLKPLKRVLQAGKPCHAPPPRRSYRTVDRERCRTRIHAILDGQEEPLGYTQLAAQLGYSSAALLYHFPQDCARLSKQIKDYRRQRKAQRAAQARDEIRQAALALHAQGVYPSQNKVGEMLSKPNIFFQPEARAILHDLCHELGWDRAPFAAP